MKRVRVLAAGMALCLCLSISAGAKNVTGAPSDWAQAELAQIETKGLIPDLTGAPGYGDAITRLQFAQLVVGMVETANGETLTPAATDTFTDCQDPAVLKAYAAKIVNGTGENTFQPDGQLTREQLASMLCRAMTAAKLSTEAKGDLSAYTDASEISDWAKTDVNTVVQAGILKGSGNLLDPKGACTVEQAILLTGRTYDLCVGNAPETQPPVTEQPGTGGAFYEKFPDVPDFATVTGDKLIGQTKMDDRSYQYTYAPGADSDASIALINTYKDYLYEHGFARSNTSTMYHHMRCIAKPNVVISLFFSDDGIAVQLTDQYKSEPIVGKVAYYPNVPNVPDFGACLGWPTIRTVELDTETHYYYQALTLQKEFTPYVDLLFDSGYYFIGTNAKNFYIFENEDGFTVYVAFYETETVIIV